MQWTLEHSKRLYFRFVAIWGEKFTRSHTHEEIVALWAQDWLEGLYGIGMEYIKGAIDFCKLNLDWPPSLAEFIRICEEQSGIPDAQAAYYLAFENMRDGVKVHPLVEEAIRVVSTYDLKHHYEKDVKPRFIRIYNQLVQHDRDNRLNIMKVLNGGPLIKELE